MQPLSWAGVSAESATAYYAALPPERVAYYLARWREADAEHPQTDRFRWHIIILEKLTGLAPAEPQPGTQYALF